MKRIGVFIIGIALTFSAFGQLKLPQIRELESSGWSIQHSVMSWDSLSIYFSAKEPQASNYDLYVVQADGWSWTSPKKLYTICTRQDELWPSVSSDGNMLFYIQFTPKTAEKGSYDKTRIVRAWYRDGRWTEAAPIIISGEEDLRPQIMEDNQTLFFTRREESRYHDGAWQKWYSVMMDDHNWTNPALMTAPVETAPILAASGTLVTAKGRKPLTTGQVLVYDATTEQLLQKAVVHPRTGRWRVALQQHRHYRLALTADGYSHHYIDIPTYQIESREERSYGEIALDDQLVLTLQTYDAETQVILSSKRQLLPLGQYHRLPLHEEGYHDTTLVINTRRPTIFTQTELDIAMRPQKSKHHFVVTDAYTGERIPNVLLRMNGQPTPADTALRVRQEHTLQVSAKGYIFYDTLFHTGYTTTDHIVYVRLLPLTIDMVLLLRNIQFEHDSHELIESSDAELEALAQLLFTNPTLRIELSSHTDDQGSDRYNDRLSSLRGQAVKDWLVARGIDGQRIEVVGYGKRKPLVPNDSEENRALNRRVEIKVIDF